MLSLPIVMGLMTWDILGWWEQIGGWIDRYIDR